MKTIIGLILAVVLIIQPTIVGAEIEGYEIVSSNDKENITLYAKKMNGLFRDFKINFKGRIYSRPFGLANQTLPMLHRLYTTET